jgi:tetratricopeptide (TPR) repeat protein
MSVTPEDWRRIKSVAAAAWDHPADARAAVLDSACAGDPWLRREVTRLLEATDAAAALYERPALSGLAMLAALDEIARAQPVMVGSRVGPYRIEHELGRGGMGGVYLAERVDGEFDHRVAIKFVGNVASAAIMERFRAERRILAALDHPNIARLLDGGTSSSGIPYVVMEYVDGVLIDEYCIRQTLSVRAKIELFRHVCGAVHHAHQRLVVHRDIKASNILVTPEGVPKLLDFGIAKIVEPREQTAVTAVRALTPESASPEQVRGEPITIAADVYALGVLLYRLLTGRSPYGEGLNDHALMQAICERLPDPPAIDRDLDLIVLKALRKEPERRYGSIEQLSGDLARYLNREPVLAVPDSASYRARKFVGRHRLGVVTAAVLALAVAGGVGATLWQARIAERERARAQGRFDDVRELARTFMFDVHDAIQNLPGSTPARRLLITRVLEYLEKLDRDAGAESRLQLEIVTAYQRVGNVQGNPYYANIGDAAGAMKSYRRALVLSQELADRDPNPSHRGALAASHHLVADMFWTEGSFADALEHYRLAVARRAALSAADGASDTTLLDLASSHYGVGQTLLRRGDYQGSAEAFSQAQALQAQALERNPANVGTRRAFATSAAKLGDVMAVQGDHRRALEYHSQAIASLRETIALDSANTPLKRLLAILLLRVSNDQNELGDLRATLASGREALALQNPILAQDPANVQALSDTAQTHRILGHAFDGLNRPREALEHLRAAEERYRAALAINPKNADNIGGLGVALIDRGDVLVKLNDRLQAREAYNAAATLLETVASREEANRYRASAHRRAGDLERQLAQSAPQSTAASHRQAACRHYAEGLKALPPRSGRAGDPRSVAESEALVGRLADCPP